ncbi:MAG TPA: hypothetical protein ACHBZ9_04845 [Arsenophonus nasoniae]
MKRSLLLMILFLIGCQSTNPPDAPQASGQWKTLNTTINDIQAG